MIKESKESVYDYIEVIQSPIRMFTGCTSTGRYKLAIWALGGVEGEDGGTQARFSGKKYYNNIIFICYVISITLK